MKRERKSITELARELRNNPTKAERKLWQHLRRRQLNGHKFLRQKPIIYEQRNHSQTSTAPNKIWLWNWVENITDNEKNMTEIGISLSGSLV